MRDLARLSRSSSVDERAPQAELLRRWLAAFGPATEVDLRWWTGWTAREVRAALAAVPHATRRARRRGDGLRARRRPRADEAAEAVGRAAPGARPDHDGLEGAGLVRRAPRARPLRHERQRRADGVVGRAGRRRLGAAEGRRDRLPAARGRRAPTPSGRSRRRQSALPTGSATRASRRASCRRSSGRWAS